MRIQISACLFSLMLASSQAFVPSSASTAVRSKVTTMPSSFLRMSTTEDEIAKLRQAAARAREDAARLAKVRNRSYLLGSVRYFLVVVVVVNMVVLSFLAIHRHTTTIKTFPGTRKGRHSDDYHYQEKCEDCHQRRGSQRSCRVAEEH